MKYFLKSRCSNRVPTSEQIRKAQEDFIIKCQPYVDRIHHICGYAKPIVMYDFETKEAKISFKLDESLDKERQRLENEIDNLRKEIESNILSY